MNSGKKWMAGAVITAFTILFYLPFFHYTSAHEVGIKFDKWNGIVSRDTPGFNLSPPWVLVAKMETRPLRVCIESVAKVINCKLAEFVPTAFQEFAQREGFRYYWWDNRLSFNSGYHDEYRGSRDLIRGYAFGVSDQRFVRVLETLRE